MQHIRPIVMVLFAFVTCGSAYARGPYGSIRVGHWKGGAYTSDTTGVFTHCAAGASYKNGNYLIVAYNAQNNWMIGITNPTFHVKIGANIPLNVSFDGGAPYHLFMNAVTQTFISAILPTRALKAFRKSSVMTMQAGNAVFQFSLASTDRLIAIISSCVAKTKVAGVSHAGNFALSIANPATKPAISNSPAKPPKNQIASASVQSQKLVSQNGTGIVVSQDGYIVTNNHVVNGCVGDITGNLTGEPSEKLRIVSKDQINDLALLRVSKTLSQVAKIRKTAVRSGDQIIAIGYPYHGLLTSDFTVTTGIVSSLSGLLNDTRYLQISAPVQPGNSGGPLLDTSGHLVGVVAAKINAIKFAKATGDLPENINFAIKTGAVRDFLDNSVVDYQTANSKAELKTAEIAQSARAFTMLISCQAKLK